MSNTVDLPQLKGKCADQALQSRYRSLVGSLIFPAATCKPDITFAAHVLSRHLEHPDQSQRHIDAAHRVFGYLRGTSDYGTVFGGDPTTCTTTAAATLPTSHNRPHTIDHPHSVSPASTSTSVGAASHGVLAHRSLLRTPPRSQGSMPSTKQPENWCTSTSSSKDLASHHLPKSIQI
jgi:hypothetical protein